MSGSLELRPKQGHREVTVHRGSLEIAKQAKDYHSMKGHSTEQ